MTFGGSHTYRADVTNRSFLTIPLLPNSVSRTRTDFIGFDLVCDLVLVVSKDTRMYSQHKSETRKYI